MSDKYPIGIVGRKQADNGDQRARIMLAVIPDFECQACGRTGRGESLLGVDDEATMWCPRCLSTSWVWLSSPLEAADIRSNDSRRRRRGLLGDYPASEETMTEEQVQEFSAILDEIGWK